MASGNTQVCIYMQGGDGTDGSKEENRKLS